MAGGVLAHAATAGPERDRWRAEMGPARWRGGEEGAEVPGEEKKKAFFFSHRTPITERWLSDLVKTIFHNLIRSSLECHLTSFKALRLLSAGFLGVCAAYLRVSREGLPRWRMGGRPGEAFINSSLPSRRPSFFVFGLNIKTQSKNEAHRRVVMWRVRKMTKVLPAQ